MMEELRAALADRVALTLINRRQIQPSGFLNADGSGIALHDDTRELVIATWQTRKQDEIHFYRNASRSALYRMCSLCCSHASFAAVSTATLLFSGGKLPLYARASQLPCKYP